MAPTLVQYRPHQVVTRMKALVGFNKCQEDVAILRTCAYRACVGNDRCFRVPSHTKACDALSICGAHECTFDSIFEAGLFFFILRTAFRWQETTYYPNGTNVVISGSIYYLYTDTYQAMRVDRESSYINPLCVRVVNEDTPCSQVPSTCCAGKQIAYASAVVCAVFLW